MLYFNVIDQFEFPFLEVATVLPEQSFNSNEESLKNVDEEGKFLKLRKLMFIHLLEFL